MPFGCSDRARYQTWDPMYRASQHPGLSPCHPTVSVQGSEVLRQHLGSFFHHKVLLSPGNSHHGRCKQTLTPLQLPQDPAPMASWGGLAAAAQSLPVALTSPGPFLSTLCPSWARCQTPRVMMPNDLTPPQNPLRLKNRTEPPYR